MRACESGLRYRVIDNLDLFRDRRDGLELFVDQVSRGPGQSDCRALELPTLSCGVT